MRKLRSSRQRRWVKGRRARSGQVSAIATILGLALVVIIIAEWAIAPLPTELAAAELSHLAQVQDELSRLQADVVAVAAAPGVPVTLTTPITLGSNAIPPFGTASTGAVGPDFGNEVGNLTYTTSKIFPVFPNWNASLGCSDTGSPCHASPGWDNITGTPNTTYTIKDNGGAPSLLLNFTGSYDTVTITWLGKSVGFVYIILNGTHDVLNLDKGSNGGGGTPNINVAVYGTYDIVATALNGQGITMKVAYIGASPSSKLCPAGNLSNTDLFYWNGTGNTATTVNVTWFNSVGYDNGPTILSVGTNSTLTFQNLSFGFTGCAWSATDSTVHPVFLGPGLAVDLQNRYIDRDRIAFDHGAVLSSSPGFGSLLISGLPITLLDTSNGWDATISVVNVVNNGNSAQGTGLVGVETRLIHTVTLNLSGVLNNNEFFTGATIALTTAYPEAWSAYFTGLPGSVITGPPSCTPVQAFPASRCLNPPAGDFSHLTAHLLLDQMTLHIITVYVGLT